MPEKSGRPLLWGVASFCKKGVIIGGAFALADALLSDCPKPWETHSALYSKENISVLEHILEEEKEFYASIPTGYYAYEPHLEDAVALFNQEEKLMLEDFLEIEEFENPTIVGMYDPGEFLLSFCGLFFLLEAGLTLFEKSKKKEGFKRALQVGGKALGTSFCLAAAAFSFGVQYYMAHAPHYNRFTNNITLNPEMVDESGVLFPTVEDLSIGLVHETTHYLQDMYGVPLYNHAILEGHAVGVTRNIGELMSAMSGNPQYVHLSGYIDLSYFASIYVVMCEKLGVLPQQELLDGLTVDRSLKHDPHATGGTLFAIREYEWGDRVYRDVLKGDYCTLLHSPSEKKCK